MLQEGDQEMDVFDRRAPTHKDLSSFSFSNCGVAFDLEGTCVDLEELRHTAHLVTAERQFGISLAWRDAVARIEHFIGGPDDKVAEDLWDLYHAELHLPEKHTFIARFLAAGKETFERMFAEEDIRPRAGLIEFMERLKTAKLPVSIGSVTNTDQAVEILKRSRIWNLFERDNIVLREDVANPKPAPDVYVETARRAGIAPAAQLVFEDSPRGVLAANAAGSVAIGMPVVFHPRAMKDLKGAGIIALAKEWHDPELLPYVFGTLRRMAGAPSGEGAERSAET